MSLVTAYRVVASHDSDPIEIMRETSKRKCAADAHVSHLPRIGDLVYGFSRKADSLLASFPTFVPSPSLRPPLSAACSRWQRCQPMAQRNV